MCENYSRLKPWAIRKTVSSIKKTVSNFVLRRLHWSHSLVETMHFSARLSVSINFILGRIQVINATWPFWFNVCKNTSFGVWNPNFFLGLLLSLSFTYLIYISLLILNRTILKRAAYKKDCLIPFLYNRQRYYFIIFSNQ